MLSALFEKQRVRLEARIGKLNGTVRMGHSVLITANGTDYRRGDQYYVSSYFFTRRSSIRHAWLYSGALRNLFIHPAAEPLLTVSVIDWTRKRNSLR